MPNGQVLGIPGAGVPIVGQAFTLLEVVPVAILVCNCEAKKTLSVAGLNAVAQCPACHRVFSLQSVQCAVDQATGLNKHNAQFAMGTPKQGD